jgi:DNA cross-link repair 1B protein
MLASGCTDMSIFTTDNSKGWIEIVKRTRGEEIIKNLCTTTKDEDYICISTDFLMLEHFNPDKINFIVPYSLHSNFREMEKFVRAVCPSILKVQRKYSN